MNAQPNWLEKLQRVAKVAETVKEMALKAHHAGEKWTTRKNAGLCPFCGELAADGLSFCEMCLGKMAGIGIKNLDSDFVRNFFGKKK